jgi:hypothetical protein
MSADAAGRSACATSRLNTREKLRLAGGADWNQVRTRILAALTAYAFVAMATLFDLSPGEVAVS